MVSHPLSEGQHVEVKQPQCPCKGASFTLVVGKILKVITNSSGIWYYLDKGSTVKADNVIRVI